MPTIDAKLGQDKTHTNVVLATQAVLFKLESE